MVQFVENFESIPVVVLACLLGHRPGQVSDGASIFPACQNLLLAARALGYGGSITMWHGGAEAAARELDVPFLGAIPLNAKVRLFGDEGSPERTFTDTDGYVSEAIADVVANAAGQISIQSEQESTAPTLTVE